MVMLASQPPDDYDGAADDYLENIGDHDRADHLSEEGELSDSRKVGDR